MKQIQTGNPQVLRWLWQAVKGARGLIGSLAILHILVSLSSIGYSLLFRYMIDEAAKRNAGGFWTFLGWLVAVTLIRLAMRAMIRGLDEYTCAKVENSVKSRLFRALLSRDYASVSGVHTGEWMNRMTSDSVLVAKGLVQIIPSVSGMLVQMVGAFAAVLILHPLFGSLLVPGGIILVAASRFLRPRLKRLHSRVQQSDGLLRILIQERLDNLLIVNAYSQCDASVAMAEERMNDHLHARMSRNHMTNLSQVAMGIALQGMYLMGAGFCAYGIMTGSVSYGTMTAVLQMIGHLQTPFSGISGGYTQWITMCASAERLMEAENLPEDPEAGVETDEQIRGFYHGDFQRIRTEDLVFSYVEHSDGHDLPVTIHYADHCFGKGEFIALAGQSGCGKSTLLKLLMCLYAPDSGKLVMDTEVGTRTLSSAQRRLFAYVPQGNQLMSGTIREILAFYDKDNMCRNEELWEALRIACADGFVKNLPQGIDTVLGEHGAGLSEGQIQRIAVARAIFSGRPILLLDEATSALDDETEAQLLQNLRTMTDRTVLIITHRPKACEVCDRVIRMVPGGGKN